VWQCPGCTHWFASILGGDAEALLRRALDCEIGDHEVLQRDAGAIEEGNLVAVPPPSPRPAIRRPRLARR